MNDGTRKFFQSVVETLLTLDCKQCKFDPVLFVCCKNGCGVGIIASHIDDFLHVGEERALLISYSDEQTQTALLG